MRTFFLLSVVVFSSICSFGQLLSYKNKFLPVETRVNDLLNRMTLDEKLVQMANFETNRISIAKNTSNEDSIEKALNGVSYGTISEMYRGDYVDTTAFRLNELTIYMSKKTRLGIPSLIAADAIHGLYGKGATIFPQIVVMGSTWNRGLIKDMASALAKELSVVGGTHFLGPGIDCAVDPRWGRVEESFSQDPFLVAEMGLAYIGGLQGNIRNGKLQPDKVFSTIKHLTAYSKPVNGINLGPASLGERELRDVHLYPYKRIIDSLGVWSVMPSYNAVNNIPCHASTFLLRDILRKEMGFDGYVYADWGAVEMLHEPQKVAQTYKDAAILAVKAGVNVNAPGVSSFAYLKEAVLSGELDESYINSAVSDVLRIKFRAGLFDGERDIDITKVPEVIHCKKHIDLAKEVAEEGCVLLTNKNILPLELSKIKSLAVIGPNAANVQFGDYSYSHENKYGITTLQGIQKYVGSNIKVNYAEGCGINSLSKDGFKEAIKAAKKSDVVVMVCGSASSISGGIGGITSGVGTKFLPTCGEGYDRPVLTLEGVQEDLIREIKKTGKPIVLVLVNGRPYTIPWIKENMNAILEAWYPGEEGGNAIANILFGKVNPSGKLTMDWPQTSGHIYTQYNYLPVSRGYYKKPGAPEKPGRDYVDYSPEALFPFGYGLSYTTFEYSNLKLKNTELAKNGKLELEVTVKNTGKREGKEIVQLYIHDEYASVTVPVKQLKGFEKISLQAGESKTVHFEVPVSELAIWDSKMNQVVEPGKFEVMIGKSSEDIVLKSFFTVK
jgi:beta-glucosidase